MDFGFLLKKQLDAAVHEECAEDVDDPVESLDEAYAGRDENCAHDERAQDSPEQHFVLMDRRHLEETKNQQEDEKVVNAERELDDVSGNELQRGGAAVPEENHDRENAGQRDPGHAPGQGFAKLYGMSAAVENAQVQHQHGEDEKIK